MQRSDNFSYKLLSFHLVWNSMWHKVVFNVGTQSAYIRAHEKNDLAPSTVGWAGIFVTKSHISLVQIGGVA